MNNYFGLDSFGSQILIKLAAWLFAKPSYKEIGNFRDTHGLSDVYNTWPSSQDAIVPTYP
jgi:hypothetical protein